MMTHWMIKKYFDGDVLAIKIQPTLETFYECEEDRGVKLNVRYMEINEMLMLNCPKCKLKMCGL